LAVNVQLTGRLLAVVEYLNPMAAPQAEAIPERAPS
jgi:hypothetical protein